MPSRHVCCHHGYCSPEALCPSTSPFISLPSRFHDYIRADIRTIAPLLRDIAISSKKRLIAPRRLPIEATRAAVGRGLDASPRQQLAERKRGRERPRRDDAIFRRLFSRRPSAQLPPPPAMRDFAMLISLFCAHRRASSSLAGAGYRSASAAAMTTHDAC